MFDRQELCARRCVRTLIEIVEQLPARWAARAPMVLDESSVGLLLLWTFIRWERRFPLTLLEDMGVDIWAFTRDIDQLLEQEKLRKPMGNNLAAAPEAHYPNAGHLLKELTDRWLRRADDEARRIGHSFLGAEHLLLALVVGADSSWSPVFTRYGIEYERLKNMLLEALSAKMPAHSEIAIDAILLSDTAEDPQGAYNVPWGASWDKKPAVGMPRKFGIAILMMMVTLFAMLCSTLQWINAQPVVYGIFGVLLLGVALGQMILFGGKYPRAASIWTGGVLLPVEIGTIYLFTDLFSDFLPPAYNIVARFFIAVFVMLFTVPIGAFFGYLAGGLTAGVVLVLEWKKEKEPEASDDALVEIGTRSEQ